MRTKNTKNEYISSLFQTESEFKIKSRKLSEEFHRETISLSFAEGTLLKFLLSTLNGKKFVEIGTLTGLSAQYMLDALLDQGELWTCEKSVDQAKKTQEIFDLLPKNKKINLVIGDAKETLEKISTHGPFDAVFIDGNKSAYIDYLNWSEKNIRKGGMIIADNIFLGGAVWGEVNQKFGPKQVKIMQEFNETLANQNKFLSCIIPTEEGLFVAIKK